MMPASEIRAGLALRVEGVLYKVIAADYHAGGGKMGGVTHAKLQSVETGTMRERRFRGDELVEDVAPERQALQFLYRDSDVCYFMHPETFEQSAVDAERLGRAADYLVEGTTLAVEFIEGRPTAIVFPDIVEMKVAETAPPARSAGSDNVWKPARLENGVRVMVPPFIAAGEVIRVHVESGTYAERARAEKKR
jgi:elongation factor P